MADGIGLCRPLLSQEPELLREAILDLSGVESDRRARMLRIASGQQVELRLDGPPKRHPVATHGCSSNNRSTPQPACWHHSHRRECNFCQPEYRPVEVADSSPWSCSPSGGVTVDAGSGTDPAVCTSVEHSPSQEDTFLAVHGRAPLQHNRKCRWSCHCGSSPNASTSPTSSSSDSPHSRTVLPGQWRAVKALASQENTGKVNTLRPSPCSSDGHQCKLTVPVLVVGRCRECGASQTQPSQFESTRLAATSNLSPGQQSSHVTGGDVNMATSSSEDVHVPTRHSTPSHEPYCPQGTSGLCPMPCQCGAHRTSNVATECWQEQGKRPNQQTQLVYVSRFLHEIRGEVNLFSLGNIAGALNGQGLLSSVDLDPAVGHCRSHSKLTRHTPLPLAKVRWKNIYDLVVRLLRLIQQRVARWKARRT